MAITVHHIIVESLNQRAMFSENRDRNLRQVLFRSLVSILYPSCLISEFSKRNKFCSILKQRLCYLPLGYWCRMVVTQHTMQLILFDNCMEVSFPKTKSSTVFSSVKREEIMQLATFWDISVFSSVFLLPPVSLPSCLYMHDQSSERENNGARLLVLLLLWLLPWEPYDQSYNKRIVSTTQQHI